MRNKLRVLLALAACLLALIVPTALADYEVNGKTIVVSGGGMAIQDAINFIDTQEDKENWIITVSGGGYHRFTVLSGMNHLTVKAAGGADVAVEVCSSSNAPAVTSGGFPNTAGVSIRQADYVTLEGLQFQVGTQSTPWYSAAVSNYSESAIKGNHVVVRGCTFEGAGTGIGVFINTGTPNFSVESCTFKGLKEAISMYGDGTLMKGAKVSGNTMENCSFAIHGYYGGTGNAGTLRFTDNTVKGTEELRSKIVIQDQTNTGALKVDVSKNTLENAIVGLVNLRESGEANNVLGSNTFVSNSCYVEAVEPGTIEFYTAYQAPAGTMGYWALTGIDDFDVDWGKNPDGSTAYIREIIDRANEAEDNELVLTGIDEANLIKTFTWFKDGIYWYDRVGGLKVTKKVNGKEADEEFAFTVTLNDRSISGLYGGMEFTAGVAAFTLAAGESITAKDLPEGLTYTVVEDDPGAYTPTSIGSKGTIRKGEIAQCEFVNELVSVAGLPTTGDDSHMALWLGCMVLSLMALAAAVRRWRSSCE